MNSTFPPLFVERIQQILPENEWEAFFEQCTAPLPRTVRFSTLYNDFTIPEGWHFTPLPEISTAGLLSRDNQTEKALGHTLEHFSGKIYAASLSSLLAVEVLNPQPHERVLDMCASPGSKTTFIADKMKNTGLLVANEMDGKRLQKLTHNLNRMGVLNTTIVQYDGSHLDRYIGETFDKILVDAPCSSEGYGRKKADFFETKWDIAQAFEMAKIQKKLIVSAFQMLKVGGEMVYSTCTSAPEENERVVQHLKDTFGDTVEIIDIDLGSIPHHTGLKHWDNRDIDMEIYTKVKRLYPHLKTDTWDSESFFISKIRKVASTPHDTTKAYLKNPDLILKDHQVNKIFDQTKDEWDIDFLSLDSEGKHTLLKHTSGSYTLTTKENAEFSTTFPHRQSGIMLMDKDNNPSTEVAIHFGTKSNTKCIQINREHVEKWLQGQDIPLPEKYRSTGNSSKTKSSRKKKHIADKPIESIDVRDNVSSDNEIWSFSGISKGIVFVAYKDISLGWGKIINGTKIKNKVPRGLIF